jgi:hypothetical protein
MDDHGTPDGEVVHGDFARTEGRTDWSADHIAEWPVCPDRFRLTVRASRRSTKRRHDHTAGIHHRTNRPPPDAGPVRHRGVRPRLRLLGEPGRPVSSYPGGADADVAGRLRGDLQASLRRLGTDVIDVFQLHVGDLTVDRALAAREVLDRLVDEGLIRTYGWSTDDVPAARAFAAGAPNCGVIQNGLSILGYEDPAMVELCESENLGSINRGPLGMGLLTGKFDAWTRFGATDQRGQAAWHPGFADGRPTQDWLAKLAAVRDVLTGGGRTLAQGALAWIWARRPCRSRASVPSPRSRKTPAPCTTARSPPPR